MNEKPNQQIRPEKVEELMEKMTIDHSHGLSFFDITLRKGILTRFVMDGNLHIKIGMIMSHIPLVNRDMEEPIIFGYIEKKMGKLMPYVSAMRLSDEVLSVMRENNSNLGALIGKYDVTKEEMFEALTKKLEEEFK